MDHYSEENLYVKEKPRADSQIKKLTTAFSGPEKSATIFESNGKFF
jgi:hypothetical protein